MSEEQCSHWDTDITERATESSQKTKPFISICLPVYLSVYFEFTFWEFLEESKIIPFVRKQRTTEKAGIKTVTEESLPWKVHANNMFIYFVRLYVCEGSHVPWYYVQQSKTS